MKTKDKKRFLAVMLCTVKVLSSVNINIPVLAEEETETEECVHEHTVIREEAGPEPTCMEDGYHTVSVRKDYQ